MLGSVVVEAAYLGTVAYVGSRTKNVGTWLLPADEDSFDAALHLVYPNAAWQCSKPGPVGLHPVHLHCSSAQAMACGAQAVQAFLYLPIGAGLPDAVMLADDCGAPQGPPPAAIVQLERSRYRHDPAGTYCDHEPDHLHEDGSGYFDAGRLAVRWYEDEVGPTMHRVLLEQTRRVFAVLTATTRPAHVEDQSGRRLTGWRIGPAAHTMITATGMLLGRPGRQRFRLV
jgi:hypothetical protein